MTRLRPQVEIHIAEEPFGCGYDITVEPPQPDAPPRELRFYADARAYADRLRIERGWAIVDCIMGAVA